MEANSGSKRKREEDYPSISLGDLIGEGLQKVMAYLEQPDRLILATTCTTMTTAVEDYSRAALAQLMQEHVVDETFEDRIKEKFLSKTEGQQEPPPPPSRCLLQAAHSTYLCTLKSMFPGDDGISGGVAFSDDGSRLVVAGTVQLNRRPPFEEPQQPPLKIYVWDLVTKEVLRTLDVPTIDKEYEVDSVYFMENNNSITVCTNQRLLVVSDNNAQQLLHDCRHPYISSATQKDSTTIVFVDDEDNAFSLNTISGGKETIAKLPAGASWWSFHGIYENRWLVSGRNNAIVTLDLQNNGLTIADRHPGYSAIMLSLDGGGPATIHLYDYGRMKALTVNETTGKFEKADTFQFPGTGNAICRGMVGSDVFLEMNHYRFDATGEAFLVVQNITTGCIRRLRFPPNQCCDGVPYMVQSNKKELFVSIESRSTTTSSGYGVEIAVYLANLAF